MAQEVGFFSDQVVTVTSARAVIAGTTYAMANITSVRTFVEPRQIGILILGLLLLLVGVAIGLGNAYGALFMALGVIMIAGYAFSKPKHWVRIATAGVESNAVYSADPNWSAAVVAAINNAIVSRG